MRFIHMELNRCRCSKRNNLKINRVRERMYLELVHVISITSPFLASDSFNRSFPFSPFLLRDERGWQVFVASRLNAHGSWQMPQGGIEDGEDPQSAAIRELREETGVVSAEVIAEVPQWLHYDFPPTVKAKVSRLWGKEWDGQAQKWFLMRLVKDESEINLATGEAKPEFSEWKWASPEEVIEKVVEYKRRTYEEVFRNFRHHFYDNGNSA